MCSCSHQTISVCFVKAKDHLRRRSTPFIAAREHHDKGKRVGSFVSVPLSALLAFCFPDKKQYLAWLFNAKKHLTTLS